MILAPCVSLWALHPSGEGLSSPAVPDENKFSPGVMMIRAIGLRHGPRPRWRKEQAWSLPCSGNLRGRPPPLYSPQDQEWRPLQDLAHARHLERRLRPGAAAQWSNLRFEHSDSA